MSEAVDSVPDDGDGYLVERFLDQAGVTEHRGIFASMFATVLELAAEESDAGNLKILRATLEEMSDAFRTFRPYRERRKVTIFGSARVSSDNPSYAQARDLAQAVARAGFMVVTGAGPGIMAAGIEGAGVENAIGVLIRLPFESANRFIASDPKLVEMRYFFSRKLMLMKESHGFAVLPGGFGTMDETFELLTLLQTGKAQPAPIVLLDVPGDGYWEQWAAFVVTELVARGLVSAEDRRLFKITDDVNRAVEEIIGFYSNYHSCRWVGDLLVIRLQHPPSDEQLKSLTSEFGGLLSGGAIRRVGPLPPERAGGDHVDLPRIALRFDRRHWGRLRELIDALNEMAPDRRSG